MGPKPLSNIFKMPMKQSSFSSHLITTVISQSFILLFDKGTKKRLGRWGEFLVQQEIEEKKLELPKQEGQGRDRMVTKHGVEARIWEWFAIPRSSGACFCQNSPVWPVPCMAWHIGLLRAGGEGGDREWDGWTASPTQWAQVWINCWETVKNREAWRAAVHAITETPTQLSDRTATACYSECRNMLAVWLYHFKLKIHVAFDIIVLFLWIYSYTHAHMYTESLL